MANYSIDDIEKMLNKHKKVKSNMEHIPSMTQNVSKRLNEAGYESAKSGAPDASGKQWYSSADLKKKQKTQKKAMSVKDNTAIPALKTNRVTVKNALNYYSGRQKDSLSGVTGMARSLTQKTKEPRNEPLLVGSMQKSQIPKLRGTIPQTSSEIPVLKEIPRNGVGDQNAHNPLAGALSGKMTEQDRQVVRQYADDWLKQYNRRIQAGEISQIQAAQDMTDEQSMYSIMVRLKNKTNPFAAFVTGIMDSAQRFPGVGTVKDWIDNLTPNGNTAGNFIGMSIEDARTQSPLAQGAGNLAMEAAKYNLASGIMSDIPRIQAARQALSGRIAGMLSPGGNAVAASAAGNKIPELIGQAASNILSDLTLDMALDTLPRVGTDVREGKGMGEIAGNAAKNIGTNLVYNVAGEGLSQGVGRLLKRFGKGAELDPLGGLENASERSAMAGNNVSDGTGRGNVTLLENTQPNMRVQNEVWPDMETVPDRVMAENVGGTLRLTEEIPYLRENPIQFPQTDELVNANRPKRTASVDGKDLVEESYGHNIAQGRVNNVTDELQNEFIDNPAFYEVLKNKDTLQKAQDIYDSGKAENQIYRLLDMKSPEAVPLANKIVSDMIDSGRKDEAVELLRTVSQKLREGGQFTQSAAITMMKSDPETALRYAVRDIDNMNAAGRQKFGQHWTDFSLTGDEIEMFGKIKPGDTDAIKKAYEKIGARLAKQYPSTRWEKFVELSRVSMLLNPRTQIRNVISNALLQPVRSLSDRVSALGQNAIHLINPDFKVTQSLTGGGKAEKELAREAWNGVKESLLGSSASKWDSGLKSVVGDKQVFKGGPVSKIFDRIFPGAISRANAAMGRNVDDSLLETVRNFTYYLLEAGDEPFVRNNFVNRLASYLKAQGITSLDQIPEDAITLATDEALKATFKDDNVLTRALTGLKKNAGKAGEIVMPFTKTPANLAMRGIDYSPAGLFNAFKMARDQKGAAEIMDYLAKNLTGTAAIAAGYTLAKNGMITGALSDDKDEAAFQKQQGQQAYSIKIGNNYYTYDWAQPAAIPFILGASMYQSIEESDKETQTVMDRIERAADMAGQAAVSASNSWLELSPLQSLADIFDTGNGGTVPENFINEVIEFPQRLIPSALGAAARTVDPIQRQTFSSGHPIQTQINTAISKIPFLSETLPAAYDTWGQEIRRSDSVGEAAFAQMINPGSFGNSAETPIDSEIQRIFDETGNNSVFPRKAEWKVGDTRLTNEQYSALQQAQGTFSYELAEGFINSPEYYQFDDAEKSEVLSDLYTFVKAMAKNEIQGTDLSAENQKLKTIYDDLGADGLARYYLYKKNADADGNGSLKKDEVISYLDSLGLSQQEKRAYFSYLSSAKNPY